MEDGIWMKGIFKTRTKLQVTPLRVFLSCSLDKSPLHTSSPVNCICICKYNTLQTQPLLDSRYQSPVYDNCHHPNVIQANCQVTEEEEFKVDVIASAISLEYPVYYTLNVSEKFLSIYSFYEDEIVWFRTCTSYPLERIYLRISNDSTTEYCTESDIKEAIDQLRVNSQNELIIFNQNFEYVHQPPPSNGKLNTSSAHTKTSTFDDILTTLPPPLFFDVLGTTPTLQGHMTASTCITVVSCDQIEGVSRFSRTSTLEPKKPTQVKVNYDNDEDDDTFHATLTSPKQATPARLRSFSASDFPYDDSNHVQEPVEEPLSLPQSLGNPKFIVELRPVLEFKLQYHFILLPKHLALQYNIFNLHNVLVHAFSSDPAFSDTPTQSDIILNLSKNVSWREEGEEEEEFNGNGQERRHIAIVRLYEGEKELEMYIPNKQLGRIYDTNDLNSAYIHPELFFYLFPETLSLTPRRYLGEIEDLMVTPSSTFSQTKTHPLSLSGGKKSASGVYVRLVNTQQVLLPVDEREEMQKFLRKHIDKLKVNKGDVFSVFTDSGRILLKVIKIEPEGMDENSGLIKDDSLYYSGPSHSFLPYLASPSSFAMPTSYWEELRPPGLEEYCEKLFSNFIVKILSNSQGIAEKSRGMSRSTVSLVSGPPGVGKKTVIRAIARQCRMQVLEINCYEIVSEAIGKAEAVLKIKFEEVIKNAPCVLILKEIHVLTLFGLDETNREDEPRLLAAFEKVISSPETNHSRFPVIIVGVTSELHLVSPRIQQLFNYEIVMTPPTLKERRGMLSGLSRYMPFSVEVDCDDIAQKTAGFVLGDYIALLSHARQLAMKEFVSDVQLFDSPKTWLTLQDIAISGLLISPPHIETALKILYSLHSSSIGAAKIPKVKWEDVGGLETAKKEILETIQLPLMHPELFATGLRRSGILLYGAPGTGKTLLAKAVATECSLNFISIKGPELINMYVGQTEENIREVFTRARGAAPCVVFFDELDSIAPNRGKAGDSGGVMDRVVSQLLAELDGMDKSDDVFVIGATNRPDLIDSALLRPGRFDRLVYLDVCDDSHSKHVILKALTRKFKLHKDVNLEEIAQVCPPGLTGADLYSLCADAMMITLRKQIHLLESQGKNDDEWEGQLEVCQEEFLTAVSNLTPSVSKEELDTYRNKKSFSNIL